MEEHLQYTGKKATVELTVKVLVEIDQTNSYSYDAEQAKDILQKRVLEVSTFMPISATVDRMYSDVKVQELKAALVIPPNQRIKRR